MIALWQFSYNDQVRGAYHCCLASCVIPTRIKESMRGATPVGL